MENTQLITVTHQLKRTERFSTFSEAVTALAEEFGMTRQAATHWVWDHSFKMGTDKKIWVTMPENEKSELLVS